MRISDWSSDVCSSDLLRRERVALIDEAAALDAELPLRRALDFWARVDTVDGHAVDRAMDVMALAPLAEVPVRSEEHTSELQSLMRISYAVFCLTKKDVNVNDPTSLHQFSGSVQQTYKHSVHRFFVPEHGTLFT